MATDFGSDVSSYVNGDLDPLMALITGPRVVAEAIARRLTTPRGTLSSDPNYGTDVRALLNEGFTSSAINAIRVAIENEAEKDERVLQASATVTLTPNTGSLTANMFLLTADGPFTMVLAISALTVSLIQSGQT